MGLGKVTIRNSEVVSNTAGWGGGVSTYEYTSSLVMENTLVAYNLAGNGGGGIDSAGCATIDLSQIVNNRSYNRAGGLRALSSVSISNSVIADNRSNNHGSGAALGNPAAPGGVTMTARFFNTTISGNRDDYGNGGGGLSVWNNATVILANSTISGASFKSSSQVQTEDIGCASSPDNPGHVVAII